MVASVYTNSITRFSSSLRSLNDEYDAAAAAADAEDGDDGRDGDTLGLTEDHYGGKLDINPKNKTHYFVIRACL